jgi:O-antigen/teichoic acid export membrane protein
MSLRQRPALRVGKNALALLLAQVWAKLLSLVLVAVVARYEATAGLGHYVLVLTIVGFAGVVSDLGLNIYLTREVAREDRARSREALLGLVLPLKLALSAVGLAGLAAIAAWAPLPAETRALLPLGALLLVPEAATGAIRSYVNGRQRMEVSSGIEVVVRSLAVAAALPALAGGLGVAGVLLSSVAASLAGVALYAAVLWRWGSPPAWQVTLAAWRACLAESYPFALTALAAMLYARIDLILIGVWRGEVAAGWYGAAYKLWETIGLLPASLLDALFPEMSRLASSPAGRGRLRRLYRAAGLAMVSGALLLAVVGVVSAGWLIPVVYGTADDYGPAVLPFRLLLFALPAMFLYLLSGHTLYALGRQRRVTVAMIAVGAANIALNLFAIPRWGIAGAAGVALISEWLLAGALYVQARRALAEAGPDVADRLESEAADRRYAE